jgi:hypothetical protein
MRCQRWVVGVGGGALLYELLATRDSFSHTCESTRALQSQRYDTIHGSVCRAFRCAPASCARLRQPVPPAANMLQTLLVWGRI